MSLIKTYLDTGIYVIAMRNSSPPLIKTRAIHLIEDSQRHRVTSDVLSLELLPNSLRRHNLRELNTINNLVTQAPEFVRLDSTHVDLAIKEQAAVKNTLGLADLLHITIAKAAGCQDFFTTELHGSPLYQIGGINVVAF